MAVPTLRTFDRYLGEEEFRKSVDQLIDDAASYVDAFARSYSIYVQKWH